MTAVTVTAIILASAVTSAASVIACARAYLHGDITTGLGHAALANAAFALVLALIGAPAAGTSNAAIAVIGAVFWWRGGGGGRTRKAARELGAKSRARVEAMARQMTPSPIPSPAGAS